MTDKHIYVSKDDFFHPLDRIVRMKRTTLRRRLPMRPRETKSQRPGNGLNRS